MMNRPIRKFKIKGMITDKEHAALSFGRQIEHYRKIEEFKAAAKSTHISQKHTTSARAIKDFIKLYKATEYYCLFNDSPDYRDDSFQVWYKTANE